jgi:hypothetical protein
MRPPKSAPRFKKITAAHRLTVSCVGQSRSGKPCGAAVVRGTQRCLFHTKGHASAAGKIGGPRRKVFDPTKLAPITAPTTAQEVTKIVATLMVEVYSAKLDAKTANCIGTLAQVFLQSLDHGDMEDRLEKLEASMKAAKGMRR